MRPNLILYGYNNRGAVYQEIEIFDAAMGDRDRI